MQPPPLRRSQSWAQRVSTCVNASTPPNPQMCALPPPPPSLFPTSPTGLTPPSVRHPPPPTCPPPTLVMRRSHIESLIHAAAAAQTQSELAQRVSTWRQRIDPILRAEEDRSAFDIHTYGTHVLDRYKPTPSAWLGSCCWAGGCTHVACIAVAVHLCGGY